MPFVLVWHRILFSRMWGLSIAICSGLPEMFDQQAGTEMKRITYITPHFAVSSVLLPDDFLSIGAMGFRSVISNLPDGEAGDYPTSQDAASLARQAGLEYRHVPIVKTDIFSEHIAQDMDGALRELPAPVLAHCASGLRSAIAWAAVAVRSQSADCVLAKLKAAGLDLEIIRDDLNARRDYTSAAAMPAVLHAGFADAGSAPA